eukprot:g13859.t1
MEAHDGENRNELETTVAVEERKPPNTPMDDEPAGMMAVDGGDGIDRKSIYWDSGSTKHLVPDASMLRDKEDERLDLRGVDGPTKATAMGKMGFVGVTGEGGPQNVTMGEAYCLETLDRVLFSAGQLQKKGYGIVLQGDGFFVTKKTDVCPCEKLLVGDFDPDTCQYRFRTLQEETGRDERREPFPAFQSAFWTTSMNPTTNVDVRSLNDIFHFGETMGRQFAKNE